MTAGRQGEDTASEVAAESTDGGATIEAAAENERVDFAIERDITVEEARRGIITRSSVPRPLLSPTIDDASTNLAEALRFRHLPLLILKSVGTMYTL